MSYGLGYQSNNHLSHDAGHDKLCHTSMDVARFGVWRVRVPMLFLLGICLFCASSMIWASIRSPVPTAYADTPEPFLIPSRYFTESGHNVGGPFLTFYSENGGYTIFGLPITEAMQKDSVYVQYFENARMEIHPNNPEMVRMTPLGTILTRTRMQEPMFMRQEPGPPETSIFFPSTGHNLSYGFRDFWERNGRHLVFGSPISEAFLERNPENGQIYTVQYFEQVRLEYRLEHPGGAQNVRVGALGNDYMRLYDMLADEMKPARPFVVLSTSTITFTPTTGFMINTALASQQFNYLRVMPGEEVSFLETVGELSAATGYVSGGGIVGGSVGQVLAGGICYVSTGIYRVVLRAGLEIVERHPHTLALPEFSDPPGMDAAVYTFASGAMSNDEREQARLYDMDLRWRNDTPDPLVMVTDVVTGSVTVSLWGYDDGREVVVRNSDVHTSDSRSTIWRYDPSLAPCEVRPAFVGNLGMRVTVERDVRDEQGVVLHNDQFASHYGRVDDVFLYGPGITPPSDMTEHPFEVARQMCLQSTGTQP